jgi:hypothetical protein
VCGVGLEVLSISQLEALEVGVFGGGGGQ